MISVVVLSNRNRCSFNGELNRILEDFFHNPSEIFLALPDLVVMKGAEPQLT
jgi:hypothetical protein